MTTRYGMIGCGMMGQEHLRNIRLLDDTAITAIYEPNPHMAAFAATLAPEAAFVDSVDALLARPDIDCVVVVSPNHCHVEQLERIADRVSLPILVEKPLYTDPADIPRIARLKRDYPAPIWVAMEYRYMPPIAALIDQADSATGGIRMLTVREHRFPFLQKVGDWNRLNSRSGGTMVEKCCHFFDLMRLVLRAEPVRVMASAGQAVNHLDEIYDGQPADIWDHAFVILDFDSGARALLELSMFAEGSRFQEHLTAIGPVGKIECHVPGPTRFWPAKLGAPPVSQLIVSPRMPKGPREVEIPVDPVLLDAGDHNGSTFYQHRRFLDVVRGTGRVEVTLDDGARAVAMGHAAQESARTGQAVTL